MTAAVKLMLKVIFRMSWFSTEVNTVTAGKDVGPYWLGLSKFVSQERAKWTRCTSCRDGFTSLHYDGLYFLCI